MQLSAALSSMIVKKLRIYLPILRLIANPDDDISLRRVINVPKRGIGATSMDKVADYADQYDLSIYQALESVEMIGIKREGYQSGTGIPHFNY